MRKKQEQEVNDTEKTLATPSLLATPDSGVQGGVQVSLVRRASSTETL